MVIKRKAMAGTLESNDVLVQVSPGGEGLVIEVQSIVLRQFGEELKRTARETALEMGVQAGVIQLSDRGALECTVRARVETALLRAKEEDK